MYPSFRIPMVLIPATLSNNVPGTEYSLGADTCLNSLMDYCDIVKQSASATRNRAFVIEVQGGNSGYIATYAALACGAQVSYVPEEGIDLAQLELDIKSLTESFAVGAGNLTKSGRLILKSINASKVLSTEVIADIMKLESNGELTSKPPFQVMSNRVAFLLQLTEPEPVDSLSRPFNSLKTWRAISPKLVMPKSLTPTTPPFLALQPSWVSSLPT